MKSDSENRAVEPEMQERLLENTAVRFLQQRSVQGSGASADSELEQWLQADPKHSEAYAKIQRAWGAMDQLANDPGIERARRAALADASFRARSRRRWLWLATAAVVVLALPLVYLVATNRWSATLWQDAHVAIKQYASGTGETRVISLADNSRVSLDAQSRIAVDYSPQQRRVKLLEGQAYFDVAVDATRPFDVQAGGKTIAALGTAFNVELMDDRMLVTLTEGRVAVSNAADRNSDTARSNPQDNSSKVYNLEPGQQLIAWHNGMVNVQEKVDLNKITAWRQGKLIFDGDDLALAIIRMNRHSHIKIVIPDGAPGSEVLLKSGQQDSEYAVSGIFDAGDTMAFVQAVEYYFPIKADRVRYDLIELHRSK